jgi:hypothetical protein
MEEDALSDSPRTSIELWLMWGTVYCTVSFFLMWWLGVVRDDGSCKMEAELDGLLRRRG